MRRLLIGARLFTGDRLLDDHALLLGDGRILDIVATETLPGADAIRLPAGSLLAPGFIDTQANGGGGVLFNATPTVAAIRTMVAAHRRFGTTGLLPTFITDAPDRMRLAATAAAEAARLPASGVLGIHLEGPFLNPEKRGVHSAAFIRLPTDADIDFLTALPAQFAAGKVLVSLAPEMIADQHLVALAQVGLVLAGAHSAASHDRTMAAIKLGLRGFTHLFNAMPPLASRAPGIAGAALASPETWCGIIADGIHVHWAMLKLAAAAKPRGKLMLVTDAMPPLGTEALSFTLYGETIRRAEGRLVTADGTLAGADLDMASAVRNCVMSLGLDLAEALRMASLYPAQFLGLDDRRGRLAPGYIADLTLLDERLRVLCTWVAGHSENR